MRHPGQVLSRQQILNGVWGYTSIRDEIWSMSTSATCAASLGTVRAVRSRRCEAWGTGWRRRRPREAPGVDPNQVRADERGVGGRRAGRRLFRSTRSNGIRRRRICRPTRGLRASICPPPGSEIAATTAHQRARPNPATTAESRDRASAAGFRAVRRRRPRLPGRARWIRRGAGQYRRRRVAAREPARARRLANRAPPGGRATVSLDGVPGPVGVVRRGRHPGGRGGARGRGRRGRPRP